MKHIFPQHSQLNIAPDESFFIFGNCNLMFFVSKLTLSKRSVVELLLEKDYQQD